jgi:pyruvate/2-oxoacid:ferredoxin oxidoreductase alpha subunit
VLDPNAVPIEGILAPSPEGLSSYRRYRNTEDGVSPLAIPGTIGGAHTSTGIEHDESGQPDYDPATHTTMTEKRWKKMSGVQRYVRDKELAIETLSVDDPRVGIITWGSNKGTVFESVRQLSKLGIASACLVVKTLNPLPVEETVDFARRFDRLLVVEMNYTGQLRGILSRYLPGVKMEGLNSVNGIPFRPRDVTDRVVTRLG